MWIFLLWLIALITGGLLVQREAFASFIPVLMIEPHHENSRTHEKGSCKFTS